MQHLGCVKLKYIYKLTPDSQDIMHHSFQQTAVVVEIIG
jgi:hypothetical protein